MKTKTKEKRKKYGKAHAAPQRSEQERGLNEDDQKKVTNTDDDDRYEKFPQNDVEAEEERERRRRIEDTRGIENES